MEALLAVVVAGLYTAGLYLLLRRSLVKIVLGLALVGHGANLLIFTAAGLVRGGAPLVPPGGDAGHPLADPLPQALILTAIVIGFGVLAFALVLFRRVWQSTGSEDLGPTDVVES
jgi:multicomponent Na+:H+ antiporter subunit C